MVQPQVKREGNFGMEGNLRGDFPDLRFDKIRPTQGLAGK